MVFMPGIHGSEIDDYEAAAKRWIAKYCGLISASQRAESYVGGRLDTNPMRNLEDGGDSDGDE